MTHNEQFRAQTLELEALKDRVRNFIKTKHWQSDGEWKESVLRAILRRHLPAYLQPLRGFVTDGEAWTRQIDILLYDSNRPVLFRDGDLVFVTPDAVAGIIEVKSAISTMAKLKVALRTLASNIQRIRRAGKLDAFAGLFAYETSLSAAHMRDVLSALAQTSSGDAARIIDIVSLGCNEFVLYWEGPHSINQHSNHLDPSGPSPRRWHGYHLPDTAAGYFINNVVYMTSPASVQPHLKAWFPHDPEISEPPSAPEDLGHSVLHTEPKHGGR